MLAIQYPWRYVSVFEELCDFHVIDVPQWMRDSGSLRGPWTGKDIWTDHSQNICSDWMGETQGIILPSFNEPGRHLLNQDRLKVDNKLNVSLWIGDRSHLKLLKEIADVVALHWKAEAAGGPAIGHRSGVIAAEEAHLFHAYEFCNLDELRRMPYRSLHTSVPITAALLGIDLRLRDRRPKNLPPFSYGLTLNDAQLEVAYNNCVAIKEAMQYARRNLTTHTR